MKSITFTYGRFQPLTKAHSKLIMKIFKVSRILKTEHLVFVSQTHKLPKDPLSWTFKVELLKEAHKEINICEDKDIKTPFQALEYLAKQGYNRVIMVVGNDRKDEFYTTMRKYATKWGIEDFRVMSAGKRDPDAVGLEGMSASKLRALAAHGESEAFKSGLSETLKDDTKELVYESLRKTMAIANRNI